MKTKDFKLLLILISFGGMHLFAQELTVEQMNFLTPNWQGERFEDGRPKVGEAILSRMKNVTIEEAWGY